MALSIMRQHGWIVMDRKGMFAEESSKNTMKRMINYKDRDYILKLVAISVCALELLITLLTLVYQQDVIKHTETPITNEMARNYMNNPEALKPNERVAYNTYGGLVNQRTYVLVKDVEEVVPFPWKAWILISVGAPMGIAFLILLLTKAYFQAVGLDQSDPAESPGKFVSTLNRLSQINIIWFMLSAVVAIFLFWYIPEIIKFTGEAAIGWLTRNWLVPTIVLCLVIPVVIFWIYLQYKLKLRAMKMEMEMEMAKFKFLQLEGSSRLLIDSQNGPSAPFIGEAQTQDNPPERPRNPGC
jgi:hypothetical protein